MPTSRSIQDVLLVHSLLERHALLPEVEAGRDVGKPNHERVLLIEVAVVSAHVLLAELAGHDELRLDGSGTGLRGKVLVVDDEVVVVGLTHCAVTFAIKSAVTVSVRLPRDSYFVPLTL